MSDKQLILAFFADQPAAEVAALTLKGIRSSESYAIRESWCSTRPATSSSTRSVQPASPPGAGVGAALLVLGPYFLGVGIASACRGRRDRYGRRRRRRVPAPQGSQTQRRGQGEELPADLSSGKAAVGAGGRIDQGPSIQAKRPKWAVPPRPTTWRTRPRYRPRRAEGSVLLFYRDECSPTKWLASWTAHDSTEEPRDYPRVMKQRAAWVLDLMAVLWAKRVNQVVRRRLRRVRAGRATVRSRAGAGGAG